MLKSLMKVIELSETNNPILLRLLSSNKKQKILLKFNSKQMEK